MDNNSSSMFALFLSILSFGVMIVLDVLFSFIAALKSGFIVLNQARIKHVYTIPVPEKLNTAVDCYCLHCPPRVL